MSDRQQDSTIKIYADLPSAGLTGTVTLTDSLGASAATATAYSEVGLKRYKCTLTITTTNTVEGLWKAVWSYSGGSFTQHLTVGDDSGSTKWDIRFHTARRIDDVWFGYITSATTTTIVDTTLIGSDDEFVGRWVVLDSDDDQFGIYRRVTAYDSTTHTLTLNSAYAAAPVAGDRFLLFPSEIRPDRVDIALQGLVETLANRLYVKVKLSGQTPDSNGFISVPNGWSHVTEVWYLDANSIWHRMAPADWACMPGQKVYIPGFSTDWTVTLHGLRKAQVPLFDDSRVDIPESVLSTGAANILHLDLAGGQATDFEAHLQRANAAFQEHGVQMTIAVPKLSNNTKKVIP